MALHTACQGNGLPGAMTHGSIRVASLHHIARAVLAATTLGGNAKVDLKIFKTLSFASVLMN